MTPLNLKSSTAQLTSQYDLKFLFDHATHFLGWTVWPDLAKFRHFGKNLKTLAIFEGIFSIWQNVYFDNKNMLLLSMAIIWNIILPIWSHWGEVPSPKFWSRVRQCVYPINQSNSLKDILLCERPFLRLHSHGVAFEKKVFMAHSRPLLLYFLFAIRCTHRKCILNNTTDSWNRTVGLLFRTTLSTFVRALFEQKRQGVTVAFALSYSMWMI